jgi:TetR/AcrR family transcriptional repressor of nem operon
VRVSREQANANRERVIEIAARLFREQGFDRIELADLMREGSSSNPPDPVSQWSGLTRH